MNNLVLNDFLDLWTFDASSENIFCFFENVNLEISIEIQNPIFYNNIKIILTDNFLIFSISELLHFGILLKKIISLTSEPEIKFVYNEILIKINILNLKDSESIFINNLCKKLNWLSLSII